MILTPDQQKALKICVDRYKRREPYTCIAGYGGSGKACAADTMIPTPYGKKRLDEIQVGDYVFDRLGKPTKVIGVYPQGKLDCYKVTFSDGRISRCNDEHIWPYITSRGNIKTKTLREMMDMGIIGNNGRYRFSIPSNHCVRYALQEVPMDSYSFGLHPYETYIPDCYKYNTSEIRYGVVQGVLDSHGSIDPKNYHIRYTSTNERFIKDLREILWSLGYESTLKSISKDRYNLNINIPNEEKYKLFRTPEKRTIALEAAKVLKRRDYNKLKIVFVEKEPEPQEMICIYVDNDEHLFLTEDFIVTHNTTLVKHVIDALGLYPDKDVAYVSYTGKASLVLRQKGSPNAQTIHRLTMKSEVNKRTGEITFTPKKYIDAYKLIVVDEISMIPQDLWQVLLSYGIHIIALGDPGQLSPPGGSTVDILQHPHFFLSEIMRQAKESDIVKLSMVIRDHKPLPKLEGNDVLVVNRNEIVTGMFDWADQIIAATNNKRRKINNLVRQRRYGEGVPDLPQEGERLICLKNYWKTGNRSGDVLVNGLAGYASNIRTAGSRQLPYGKLIIDFLPEEYNVDGYDRLDTAYFKDLHIDRQYIETGEPGVNKDNWHKIPKKIRPKEFDFGYCITAWKAQGSEWDNVLIFEESFPFDREEHIKYLYTCLTRASKKAVIVRK